MSAPARKISLKYYADVNPLTDEFKEMADGEEVAFLPLENIWAFGSADYSERRAWKKSDTSYTQFRRGDVLVPKVTPTVFHGRSMVTETETAVGLATSEVHVLRPKKRVDARWITYNVLSSQFLDQARGAVYGVGGLQRISAGYLGDYKVLETDYVSQQRIADYLDREIAEIDAAVADLDRYVELLEKRRGLVITNTVTGRDRELLKDSGMHWLGEVAADWDLVPAWALFTEGKEKCSPDDPHLVPSRVYGVVTRDTLTELSGNKPVDNEASAHNMKHVEPHDFIISMGSHESGIEHSRLVGKVSNDYRVLRPTDEINPEYYKWFFKSEPLIEGLRGLTTEIRVGQRIHYSKFSLLRLPLPPLEDQQRIADYLDHETTEIDSLIAESTRLRELLLKRRSVLITEVVTGRKEF